MDNFDLSQPVIKAVSICFSNQSANPMLISKNDDEIIPTDADACYEKVASQEQICLEETE